MIRGRIRAPQRAQLSVWSALGEELAAGLGRRMASSQTVQLLGPGGCGLDFQQLVLAPFLLEMGRAEAPIHPRASWAIQIRSNNT